MYVVDLDAEKLATARAVRDDFFGEARPATSSLLEVAALARPDCLFEINVVAAISWHLRTELLESSHSLDEVVVAEGKGEPNVPRCPKGFTRHESHLRLL